MMRLLWLDYQQPDPGRHRPGVLLLVAGVVATGVTSADYFAVAAELDAAQSEVAQLRLTAAPQRPRAAAAAAAPVAAGHEAASPPAPTAARWEALFASLEAAADDTVTLLSLHPGAKEIQISGEAKDFAASMDYVKRLQSAPALANARLTQSEVAAENPRHPVKFALVADWRGAP
ncbi:MAG: PilN domain-containing protein [Rhodocyclaceae bacterium]|nr:PilN domain-containing protein [Rhodocyclaceae bacterium]